MISRDDRPRLAAKARLRLDRQTGRHLLLYPESGLELGPTAADVLLLCSGERTVAAIAAELAGKYAAPAAEVECDVLEFLDELVGRALVGVGR